MSLIVDRCFVEGLEKKQEMKKLQQLMKNNDMNKTGINASTNQR